MTVQSSDLKLSAPVNRKKSLCPRFSWAFFSSYVPNLLCPRSTKLKGLFIFLKVGANVIGT